MDPGALRRRIAALTREARQNEAAWKANQRFEMQLLEADSIADLLERLTSGMQTHFGLDRVTLVVADEGHRIRHLLIDQGGSAEALAYVRFVDAIDTDAPELGPPFKPWLGTYSRRRHGGLFGPAADLASVALLPLARQGRLLGILSLGSRAADRFTPEHASDFLEHLAAIAAYCVENTVNRARLLRTSFRDILTGWYNRRYLMTRLVEEVARSNRDRTPLVCLMIDVDHFKPINDSWGHLAGDAVLRSMAARMSAEIRRADVAARYGGEEFVILLPTTDAAAGRALADRIRAAVDAEPLMIDEIGRPVSMTVSIGISEHAPGTREEDAQAAGEGLLADADRALYEAKAAGRNRVVAA